MKMLPRIMVGICAASLLVMSAPAAAQQQAEGAEDGKKTSTEGPQAWLEKAERLYHRGEWPQAQKAYEKAYKTAPKDSVLRAEAGLGWSSLLWEQGDYKRAAAQMDDALKLAEKLELDAAIGRLLLTKGHIEASRGRLRSAEHTLGVCMKTAADQGDEVFSALCAINRRLVRQMRGRPVGPESDYRKAIARLKSGKTPLAVGSSLAKTAGIYEKSGHPERALELLHAAQQEFDKASSVPAKLRNRLRIAKLLQDQGRHGEARKYLAGQVPQFQAMNNRPALVDALMLSAVDAGARGQQTEAGRLYARALNVARQTASPTLIARGHLSLCEFGQRSGAGQPAETLAHCKSAVQAFAKLDVPTLAARSQAELAGFYHAHGQLNEASTEYSRAIQLLEKAGRPGAANTAEIGRFRANLCQIEMTLGGRGAYYLCKKALAELQRQKATPLAMLAATEYAVGVSAGRDGWAGHGLKHLKKAAKLAREQSPPDLRLAADAYLRLGVIYAAMKKRRAEANQAFEDGIALVQLVDGGDAELAALGVQLRTQLAQLQLKNQEWKTARNTLSALIVEKATPTETKAWAYSALARAELKLGDKKAAKQALKEGLPLAQKAGDRALIESFEENLKKFE